MRLRDTRTNSGFEVNEGDLITMTDGEALFVSKNDAGYFILTNLTSAYSIDDKFRTGADVVGYLQSKEDIIESIIPAEQLELIIKDKPKQGLK